MLRKIIITGGTCSGKSTLIAELSSKGYQTIPEAARTVIIREQEKEKLSEGYQGTFPWNNLEEFQRLVQIEQINLESKLSHGKLAFLDRSLIDGLSFYEEAGLVVPDLTKEIQEAGYESAFFLQSLPIYEKDLQRKEDHGKAIKLAEINLRNYSKQNFPFTIVPVWPLEQRVDFILKNIGGPDGLY